MAGAKRGDRVSHFQRVVAGIDVTPLLAELHIHPELWDLNRERTLPGSPHEGVPDIWVRTRPPGEHGLPGPFVPQMWPAWFALPSITPIAFPLMARFRAVQLGNILITRVPAGGEVKEHCDLGWGPEFFDLKFYIVLQGNPACVNWCGGETVAMDTGEAWMFRNTIPHGVVNRGTVDRISLIITMRSI